MTQPAEHDVFLEQIANTIYRRGLRTPVLIALEAGEPLAFLGGQLLWLVQPFLSLIIPNKLVRQTAQLLEEPAAVQALIKHLEMKGIE